MLNLRSHLRSTELWPRFLAKSPGVLHAHSNIESMFYQCWLLLPTGHLLSSFLQPQPLTNFPLMWIAACWMSPRCPTGMANQTPCPASHHCPLPALLDGAAVHPAPVGIQTPLCPIHLHPINQVLLETFSFKLFLISASPLLFYCTCPSLDFHPLSPRLVRETSNRFTGVQPFLLVFPMPLPVTFLSSWLPGNTHSLFRTPLWILSSCDSFPHPDTHPRNPFLCFLNNPVPHCPHLWNGMSRNVLRNQWIQLMEHHPTESKWLITVSCYFSDHFPLPDGWSGNDLSFCLDHGFWNMVRWPPAS